MTSYYPAFLDLHGRRCVVIGGGAVAERKVRQLLASGADVTVVSPDATPELERLADDDRLRWIRRAYAPGDLAGAWVAVAATSDGAVHRTVHDEAEREGTLLNVVDAADLCGFIAPSIVERGPVTVAISTGGASPALARKLRELIGGARHPAHDGRGGPCRCMEWADAAGVLAEVRAELRAGRERVPAEAWQEAMDQGLLDLIRTGREAEAKKRLRSSLLRGPGA